MNTDNLLHKHWISFPATSFEELREEELLKLAIDVSTINFYFTHAHKNYGNHSHTIKTKYGESTTSTSEFIEKENAEPTKKLISLGSHSHSIKIIK